MTDGAEAVHGTGDDGGTPSPAKTPGALRALRKRRRNSSPLLEVSVAAGAQPLLPHPSSALPRDGPLPSPLGNPPLHNSTVFSAFSGGTPFGTGREGLLSYGGEMGGPPAMQSLTIPTPYYNHVPLSPAVADFNCRWVRTKALFTHGICSIKGNPYYEALCISTKNC